MENEINELKPYLAPDGTGVLFLNGSIGSWGFNQATLADVEKWAAENRVTHLRLRINSPGGDPVSAMAVVDMLAASPLIFEAEVFGICASAATLVALGCASVRMSKHSQFMVHHPYGFISGELAQLEAALDNFRSVRQQAFDLYSAKTGKTVDQIMADHTAGKWYTAQEALDYGFIDGVIAAESDADKTPTDADIAAMKMQATQAYENRGILNAPAMQKIAAMFGMDLASRSEMREIDSLKSQLAEMQASLTAMQAERDGALEAQRAAAAEAQEIETMVAQRVAQREAAIRAELSIPAGGLPQPADLAKPEKINFSGMSLPQMLEAAAAAAD